eukprot:1149469-Pelagomonas_calceolata.AAC.3
MGVWRVTESTRLQNLAVRSSVLNEVGILALELSKFLQGQCTYSVLWSEVAFQSINLGFVESECTSACNNERTVKEACSQRRKEHRCRKFALYKSSTLVQSCGTE